MIMKFGPGMLQTPCKLMFHFQIKTHQNKIQQLSNSFKPIHKYFIPNSLWCL